MAHGARKKPAPSRQNTRTAGEKRISTVPNLVFQQPARLSPRQALLVEGRFFGGLSWTESAESLGISEATVMREWRAARAWLACEMRRQSKLGTPAQLSKVGA